MNFEPLLTSEQAAALLQIHAKTLQRMARDGQVPGIQIGRQWRFRTADMAQWVDTKLQSTSHSCLN